MSIHSCVFVPEACVCVRAQAGGARTLIHTHSGTHAHLHNTRTHAWLDGSMKVGWQGGGSKPVGFDESIDSLLDDSISSADLCV